jgi:hypothetical protein
MKLMRHSDIKLTAKVYTDETQLPIYDAIKNLPRLDAVPGYTQLYAQILGGSGQNGSQPVAKLSGSESDKTIENKGDCRGLAQCGVGGQMERAKGFEPSTLTLAT